MIYLITQLTGWLLLAAAFAAMSGWVYAAVRARPAELARTREREKLVRDLGALALGDGVIGDGGELETLRSRVDVEAARAAEAEHALETARSRAEEATGRVAALQRAIEQRDHDRATYDAAPPTALDVEATPVEEAPALQSWRLRYFEQRVRYLESASESLTPDSAPLEWRARVAEARAAHLEQELRDVTRSPSAPAIEASPAPEIAAFAADVETDALLRWRMLYLERRVAHLQEQTPSASAREPIAGPDPDSWKWRARYLEARLRHLETQTQAPIAQAAPSALLVAEGFEAAPVRLVPAGAEVRPATLPGARGGGPDDLTLIEGVTLLQQTTLYSLGVFHFDQIAEWSPANVAWVDQYLRLRGRIVEEEWVEQADELAREGPAAARRGLESEPA